MGTVWSWMGEPLTSPAQQPPLFLDSLSQAVLPSQQLCHAGFVVSPCTSLIRAGLILPKLTRKTELVFVRLVGKARRKHSKCGNTPTIPNL